MAYLFQYKRYRLPMRVPLRTAHGMWTEREGIIVRLEDEGGQVGFGEIAPIPGFGTESLAEAEKACQNLGSKVGPAELDFLPETLTCVHFAIAMARMGGGGAIGTARLPVAALLPAGAAARPVLAAKLAAGFLAFKWKVGVFDIDEELGVLDELLSDLPAHAKLRLDANGVWTRREAARWLERCAERPIEFVEQPVAPIEEDTLRGLARDYPVTLALDESVFRLVEARRWQALGWPGVFVLKPALAGPLEDLVRWVLDTKADAVISSAIETALGRAVVLRAVLGRSVTKRALGFGVGEIFGNPLWDGPAIGPLADADCIAVNAGPDIWSALS